MWRATCKIESCPVRIEANSAKLEVAVELQSL